MDAYSGSITYYADLEEPIIQVWDKAFPGLFTTWDDDVPAGLQDHFRYPENLFQVQAYQYANYHVTDPAAFYQKRDFWQIPSIPRCRPPRRPNRDHESVLPVDRVSPVRTRSGSTW